MRSESAAKEATRPVHQWPACLRHPSRPVRVWAPTLCMALVLGPQPAGAQAGAATADRSVTSRPPPTSKPAPGAGKAAQAPSALAALSAELEDIASRVGPSVVQVLASGLVATDAAGSIGLSRQDRSAGTGVILASDGFIITNAHVVAGATRLTVVLPVRRPRPGQGSLLEPLGRSVEASLVGLDLETDLAVLKVAETGLEIMELADSDQLRAGQIVLAFGGPPGLEKAVTIGVVSSTARQLAPEDPMVYIQTDAPTNPGNSGGPLVDIQGRCVGINTLILTRSGGHEGIGFAAPSNIVRTVFEQLRSGGRVQRGVIGVDAQTIDDNLARGLDLPVRRGVVLGDVLPGGPAAEAGLRVGDVVLAMNGKPMENARQLEVNIYRRPIGSTIVLDVLRGQELLSLRVFVAERADPLLGLSAAVNPEQGLIPELGILAVELSDTVRALLPRLRHGEGVVVAARAGSSRGAGLQPGDVIHSINRRPVRDLAELRALLATWERRAPLAVQVERSGRLTFVGLEKN